jgi:hypothetical protein
MSIRSILTALLVVSFSIVRASDGFSMQQDTTITWQSDEAENLKTADHFTFHSGFRYDGQKIEWIQKAGALVHTFMIQSLDDASTENESIRIYTVTYEGKSGKITIRKSSSQHFIVVDLTENDPDGISFKFTVATVDVQTN